MGFYTDTVYSYAIEPVVKAFTKVPEFIAAPVINIMLVAVVLSITWQGFEVIRGAGGANPILDVIFKNLRPMFILLFAATAQGYSDYARPFITEDLIQLFIGAVNESLNLPTLATAINTNSYIFELLDNTVNVQMSHLNDITRVATKFVFFVWWDYNNPLIDLTIGKIPKPHIEIAGIPVLLISGIIYLVVIITSVIVALQACFVVIGWNFVLGFGPIFLAMYAFAKTEKYADHWLQSALRYTFSLIVLITLYLIFSKELLDSLRVISDWYNSTVLGFTYPSDYPGGARAYQNDNPQKMYLNFKEVGEFARLALRPIVLSIVAAFILTKADQMAQDLIGGGLTGSGAFMASAGGRMMGAGRSVVGAAAGAAGAAAGLGYAATAGKGHSNPLAQVRAGMSQSANEKHAATNARREHQDKKAYGAAYYPGISLLQRKPK